MGAFLFCKNSCSIFASFIVVREILFGDSWSCVFYCVAYRLRIFYCEVLKDEKIMECFIDISHYIGVCRLSK